GSGLGLNIVYNIVRQRLGGSIEVHSEVNKGTTFTITMPCSAPVNQSKENIA
ncbi:ATP-binding protein, partial [Chromobacterium haemolyticum]